MSKITKYALSDLYDMSSGLSSKKEQAGHGAPFVSFGTVFNNYFLPEELPDLMDTNEKEQQIYSIKTGDVLITRTSETIDELAMSCVAVKDYPKATYSGFTKRLRPKREGIAYPKYMAFYFRSALFRKAVTNNAFMTLRASFNEDIFTFLDVYLPDYDEQVRIGDMLYNIECKIQKNKEINDYLEQQALLIFSHMFQNISYGLNYVGDYITPKRGKALLSKDAIPGCVPVIAGGLVPATYHNMANTVAPVLTISGSGANAGYVNIWHDPVWSSDSSYIDYEMTPNVYFWYAFLKLRQQDIFDIQTGSAQPHIYPKHIAELSIGDIDNFKVESYTSQVTPLFAKIGANVRENKELQQLRDWLLPMLMNGQATIEDYCDK